MAEATIYTDDGAYLDAEFNWLSIRAKRIAAERVQRERALDHAPKDDHTLGDQELVADDENVRRVAALREREAEIRAEIDLGLAQTRRERGDKALGLDRLVEECHLTPQERLVLLLALAPAIGDEVAQLTSGEINGSYYHSPTIEVAISMLDAVAVADRVRCRCLFTPTASLIKHGLLTCDFHTRTKNAEVALDARIYISRRAFDTMVGAQDMT